MTEVLTAGSLLMPLQRGPVALYLLPVAIILVGSLIVTLWGMPLGLLLPISYIFLAYFLSFVEHMLQ